MKAYCILDNDVCINCLNVSLFHENKKISHKKKFAILGLDLDPDPHSAESLDPDLHLMNADTKHCQKVLGMESNNIYI
jgi:hypothetical protein